MTRLSALEAARIARHAYGLEARASSLPGYANQNFLIETVTGDRFVLKAAGAEETNSVLDFQHRLLEHVAAADLGFRTPRVVRARDGNEVVEWEPAGGAPLRWRLLTWLPGTVWARAGSSPDVRRELGSSLARLDRCLADFSRPSPSHDPDWDLRYVERLRDHVEAIPDGGRRRLADGCLHRFAAYRLLHQDQLRQSVIHGDANEHNLLVDDGRLVGVLDFGNALASWTVCDLAIAVAYSMLGESDPLAAACDVVAGYQREYPLADAELAVLFPFACGRLAQTVVNAARRRREGSVEDYLFVSEEPAWAALEKLAEFSPAMAERTLRRAAGCEAPAVPPTGDELLAARRRHIAPSLSLAYDRPLHMSRGFRQYLFGADGRPYLDLVNNVCHVGHCHPTVVAAAARQMATLNTNTRYLYDGLTAYAERLTATLPAGLDVCFLVNSGSEANELAIRLARAATGRRDLLVLDGAYHGHTTSLIEASPYKFLGPGGGGLAADWVRVAPMPDPFRGAHRGPESGPLYAAEIERAIAASPRPLAGFLCEPILGCGGQIVPPAGFLSGAYDAIRRAGGVAIADEVQVGFGRPGSHFWAFETQRVVPDVVVMGKPIGNGHPLAAVVTTRDIANAFANGMEYFATFGGNPVSCAIGMAVLDVIEREELERRAAELGERMLAGLRTLARRHPLIGDVRGLGLFAGVELVSDRDTLAPATAEAARVVDRLARRGLLLSTDGPFANVLKIKPPMVLEEEDVDFFLRELDAELARVNG